MKALTRWRKRCRLARGLKPVHYSGKRELRLLYAEDRHLFFVAHDSARWEVKPGTDLILNPETYSINPDCFDLIEEGIAD